MSYKFTDYTLKNNFEFLVYVSRKNLLENEFTNCLDLQDTIPGLFRRKEGQTILQIADQPLKKGLEDEALITDKDYVRTYEDDGRWYAESFDGKFLFTINKYYFKGFNITHRGGNCKGVSEWFITDFEISDLFLKDKSLKKFSLDIDLIFEYFNFRIKDGEGELQKILFDNIKFNDCNFSIMIGEEKNTNFGLKSITRSSDAKVVFSIERKIDCNFSFDIMILFRNLMQVLTNMKVGINKIILGEQKRTKGGHHFTDRRRNWFINQSFVSDITGGINFDNLDTNFKKLEPSFNGMLKKYFDDQRLQELVTTYVITFQMKMPISTILVTLSSGIETYLRDETYSNGRIIKDFKSKLRVVVASIDSSKDYSDLIEVVKDSRDFFVHGIKKTETKSEVDLIPYVNLFQKIYRKYIIKELFKYV